MLNNINLLFTNCYKVSLEQVSKDTSIDSLKIKLYREYSDKLPIPSNVFIENEQSINNINSSTTTDIINNGNNKKIKEQDDFYSKSYSKIVHQNQIRLIFGGKQLDNFSTLEDNGVESGDTILVTISPYISNIKKELDKMVIDNNNNNNSNNNDNSSSDTVFLGIPIKSMTDSNKEPEKPIFKLSINDRSYRQQQLNQDQSQLNLLEKLNDNETFTLLNRIKDNSKNNNNQPNINNNNDQNVKLIPINNNISLNNSSNEKSLETLIDRLSLHDIPTKDTNINSLTATQSNPSTNSANLTNPTAPVKHSKLEIQTFTPVNEVSACYFIKIIFNRPFLPLVNQIDNYEIPIIVEPKLENGKWSTIDGLVFEYKCVNPNSKDDYNLTAFPLSTEFKVTVESNKFKSLYNEDIDPSVYTFKTISQSILSTEFNGSFKKPQILLRFSQPIKLLNNKMNDIFSLDMEPISGSLFKMPLLFRVLSNDDPHNYYSNKPSFINDSSIVLDILSNINNKFSYYIHLSTNLSSIGSSCGPLITSSLIFNCFKTPELLSIYPKYMDDHELSCFSYVEFNSNCTLKPFDFILARKTNTISNYVTIDPDIKIRNIDVQDKSIKIYANFKPLTTYGVSIKGFQDSLSYQTSEIINGYFSFPDYPQKIYLTKDSYSSQTTFYDYFNTDSSFYNLDPFYSPSVNLNTEGISKLLVSAYEVSNISLEQIKKVGKTITITVERRKNKNKNKNENENEEEEEEELSIKTNIDLSKFYGTNNSNSKPKYSILLFKFKSYHDSNVKLSLLLQYSPLTISHFEIGHQVSLMVSNVNSNKLYDDDNLSITLFNKSTNSQRKPLYKKESFTLKYDHCESTHLLVQTNDGFSLIYKTLISKSSNKKYQDKWSVINSSGIYRPGETVYIHGLIRLYSDYNNQILAIPNYTFLKSNNLLPTTAFKKTRKQLETISYKVYGGKKEVLSGETMLKSENGSFDFKFELPLDINLGSFYVDLEYNEIYKEKHYFDVQEFKKKQFLVESSLYTLDSTGFKGSDSLGFSETQHPFSVQVFGKSYTGEILQDTMVEWNINVTPSIDSLENIYSNYKFNFRHLNIQVPEIKYTSKRNKIGRHHLDFVLDESHYTCNVTIDATVIDVTNNRESITNKFYIQSSQLKYFGLSKDIKPFVNSDDELVLDMILCDSNGSLGTCDGKINVIIKRMPWAVDLPSQVVLNHTIIPENNKSPIIYNYKFKNNGIYRVSLIYTSDDTNIKTQEFHFNVYSLGKQTIEELNYIEQQEQQPLDSVIFQPNKLLKKKYTHCSKIPIDLKCTLDKDQYQLNQTAILLITSKLSNANGFVFFFKNDYIIDKYPIIVSNSQVEFKFKVNENYLFNTSIMVYLEGFITTITNGHKVSRLSNEYQDIPLRVDYRSLKQLNIEFSSLKKFQAPSEESSIVVNVKDPMGKPLSNAQVTMMIVDNAILDISKHSINDPLDYIYNKDDQFYINSGSSLDSTMYKLFDDIVDSNQNNNEDIMDENDDTEEFEIYINYFSGRTIIIKVSNLTPISKIRDIIKERDGLPENSQRLFYLNRQIDSGIVKDYSIKPGSVLKLVIRLFGGGGESDAKVINEDQQTLKSIKLRDNFNSVAHFSTINTDNNGNAKFSYKLPDNLTLYKVMVLATYKHDSFGIANDYFVSKLPVQIRPSPPRFLNHHDTATFPISISNVLDFDLTFEGAFRSDNCKLLCDQGYKCKLPANSRIIVPITCKALVPNSTSNFEFVARTLLNLGDGNQELCDAVSFKIPILNSTSLESTTINNSLENIDQDYEYGLHQLKFDNWQQLDCEVGGLSIQLNTDPLQKATLSIQDLLNYDYYCTEQIASKLIALYAFIKYPSLINVEKSNQIKKDLKVFDKDSALAAINGMITSLRKRISKNFGFRYWDSTKSKEYEYISMYAFWILNQISDVSQEAKYLVEDYCKKYITTSNVFKYDKSQEKETGTECYLFKKAISTFFYGQIYDKYPSIEFIEKLHKKAKKHLTGTKYHQVFIYLSQFLRSDPYYSNINNYLNITGTLAHLDFNTSNSISGFTSNIRCQAILIMSLLEDKNKTHLLNKLVSGLSHYSSRDGYYYTTQDNAFNLISISQYYSKYFKDLPENTTTSIQLNNHYIENNNIILSNPTSNQANSGNENNKKFEVFLPFKQVLKNQSNIIIEKKSKGILFYTLNLSYATLNPIVKSISSRGFSIKRKYIPILNTDDVIYINNNNNNENNNINQLTPNIQVKAGSKIKISLEIQLNADSTFVAIKDRLPAGLEPIDSKSTQYNGYWSSHVNNRETGIEIFSDLLFKGTYYYNYYAIAITPGIFIAPPVKIEEMYCPASFGRSQCDVVLIK